MSDEIRSVSSTGAEKGVKPERFDLIPYPALKELAKLYGKGAEKYAEHNWRHGYEWSKSYSALMRHANQFWDGEDIDEEMGLSHMAAVAFHAFALLTFIEEHPEFDDRFKKPALEFDLNECAYLGDSETPQLPRPRPELFYPVRPETITGD